MAIILPEAQTGFGVAPQPRLNAQMPNGFDALGTLGDAGVAVAVQRRKINDDRALREARLAAMGGLDQTRLAFEHDTNLDGLTDRWQTAAGDVVKGASANLPSHLQRDFDLSMQEMMAPQTSAIRSREAALFRDQAAAQLNGDLRGFVASAAAAPTPDAQNAVYAEAARAIGAAQDADILSAVEADKMMAALPAATEEITALKLIEDDPAAYLEGRKSGQFGFLPPGIAAKFDSAAKANLAQITAANAKAASIASEAAARALTTRADDAIALLEGGLKVAELPVLMRDLAGTADYDRVQGAVDAVSIGGNFAMMTPAEQAAELAAFKARGSKNPSDVGLLNRLEGMAAKTTASLEADPLAHIRNRGIAAVPPVDLFDPASVASRVALAESVWSQYTPGAQSVRYFDKAEADQLAGVVGGANADDALRVLAGVIQNFGPRAPAALAQIGAKDPVLTMAGAMVLETGDVAAARTVLQGRTMRAQGTGAKISNDMQQEATAKFAAAFPAADAARLDLLTRTAVAHYAASGASVADAKSPEAATAFEASMQAVLGAQTRNGRQYGGMQPIHGQPSILPPSLTAAQVEQALVYFDATAWQRASASGAAPMMRSQPMLDAFDQYARQNLTVMSLSNGEYALGYRYADGSVKYMNDPSQADGMFRFDLEKLVLGVSHGR